MRSRSHAGEGVKESVSRTDLTAPVAGVDANASASVPSTPSTPTPGGVVPVLSSSSSSSTSDASAQQVHPQPQTLTSRMDVDAKSSELLVHPGANVDQAAHALNKCFRPTTVCCCTFQLPNHSLYSTK